MISLLVITHYSNRKIDLKEGAKTVKVKAKLMKNPMVRKLEIYFFNRLLNLGE